MSEKTFPTLLTRLSARANQVFQVNEAAQKFLRNNGVTECSVAESYRVGAADPSLLETLSEPEREALRVQGFLPAKGVSPLTGRGLLFPTYDPRSPGQPVGMVKLNFAQNKSTFITAPRGIGCREDISAAPKVILADAPFLTLKLAQAGVQGVAFSETPEVLQDLADWLKGRAVIVISHKKKSLEAYRSVFEALGVQAEFCVAHSRLHHSDARTLELLGLIPEQLPKPQPLRVTLTQKHVVDLVRYAQERLATGQGVETLKEFGINDPAFVVAWGLGYLPADYSTALSKEAKSALGGRLTGNSVLIPAYDSNGVPDDVLALGPITLRRPPDALRESPAGLIAHKVATAYPEIVVTDSFTVAVRLFEQGLKSVLLLRGAADAQLNAQRLLESGVRKVSLAVWPRTEVDGIKAALEGAGHECQVVRLPKKLNEISPETFATKSPKQDRAKTEAVAAPVVEKPDQTDQPVAVPVPVDSEKKTPEPLHPDKPVRISFDARTERATFKVGDALYAVETDIASTAKLEVRLECAGKVHLDRLDLSKEAQRKRFGESAALATGVPFEKIQIHLIHLLDSVRQIQEEKLNPAAKSKPKVELTEADKKEALAFLARPDLLDAIAGDLEALGWVGEENSKRLLYLIGISRKLLRPLSGTLRAPSGAGKSTGTETIALLSPPEDVMHVSRLTDTALYYQDRAALRHKLLVVDEADALSPEVLTSLRVLQSRGALSQSYTQRDPSSGQTVTYTLEVQGPVAVLTSTTRTIDEQNLSRCFEIGVDESPEQTRRIQDAQRKVRTDPCFLGHQGTRAKIVARHHALQRMLETLPVVIPFADRIEFPSTGVKFRREHDRFLNLIEASALLHQGQRMKGTTANGESYILANERDFQIALALAAEHVARANQELSQNARGVLDLLQASRKRDFTLEDLQALKPEWTRYRFRAGLEELLELEHVTGGKGGRGKVRRYTRVTTALPLPKTASIRLRAVGELAKVGETPFANLKPSVKTG